MNKKAVNKNKILHIKYSDGVSEKELKTGNEEITIGKGVDNLISLADFHADKLPIFKKKGGSFYLIINTEKIKDAQVSLNNVTLNVNDLISHSLLPKLSEKVYAYKITDGCSGTIKTANAEIRFSLCEPLPLPEKPFMPKEFRKRFINRQELGFINIFTVSFAIHILIAVIIHNTKVKEKDITNVHVLPKRFARLILGVTPKPAKEILKAKGSEGKKEEKEKEEEIVAEEKKEEKEKKPKEDKIKEADKGMSEGVTVKTEVAERSLSDEKIARREQLKQKGVLAMLTGKRASGSSGGGTTTSHFISDSNLSQDIDKVLTDIGGLQNVAPTDKKGKGKGDGSGEKQETVAIDNLIAQKLAEDKSNIKTVELKEQKRANLQELFDMVGSGAGNPKRSKEVISSVVQTYIGGLKYLYDAELRKDPTLEGKVTVQFTILANGKVANCIVTNTTMNNKDFESSILKRLQRWTFEPIDEGEVVITYPFVFFPVISG